MEEKKGIGTVGTEKWKEVVVGGVSGIALGAIGTLFASSVPLNASAETPNAEAPDEAAEAASPTALMASGVNDSMSFADAFSAARAEVGAGGVFEWHGNIYSTYTANEWNNMDDAARNEFAASVSGQAPSHEHTASHQSHAAHSTHAAQTETAQHAGNTTNGGTQQNQTPEKDDDDLDVEIIGIEHANIDGEHNSIIGTANMGGQSVYFIDIDGEDDEFELMVTDLNGNQQIDEGEVIDISQQHVSVSQFEQMAQAQHAGNGDAEQPVQYYANNEDLPDYVNDADPGALA